MVATPVNDRKIPMTSRRLKDSRLGKNTDEKGEDRHQRQDKSCIAGFRSIYSKHEQKLVNGVDEETEQEDFPEILTCEAHRIRRPLHQYRDRDRGDNKTACVEGNRQE